MSQNFPSAVDTIEAGLSGAALGASAHNHLTAHGDISFAINKIETVILSDTWTTTSASFTIPAFNASVTMTVNVADSLQMGQYLWVNDGTHKMYCTITLISSLSITVLNIGQSGNSSSSTMASGAIINVGALPPGQADVSSLQMDFLPDFDGANCDDWQGFAGGTGNFGQMPWLTDHLGLVTVTSGTASGDHAAFFYQNHTLLSACTKAVFRFVVSYDTLFATANNGQFFFGLSDTGYYSLQANGVGFLFDPADSATSLSATTMVGSVATKNAAVFNISAAAYYDLWISYVSGTVKFYASTFGTEPVLVSTITTNIPSAVAIFPVVSAIKGATGTTARNVLIDLFESVLLSSKSRRFLGQTLIKA